MNRRILLTCILLITFCIATGLAQQSMPGGWAKAPVNKKEVVDAVAFAIKAQKKAVPDAKGGQPTKLELVKIIGAEEQVVAGMNYRLRLKVKVHGKEKQAEAVVWWQAWRKQHPYQLTSWKWSNP
ncbi:MAG: cystatin domain-containing protein [Verrucomicrobia bacterium]|nr:cystatin domain-containing protein [Verrucomicrobiota bacterium]